MQLNSSDVLTKTFTRKLLGGYSSSEVLTFLQDIAEELKQKDEITKQLFDTIREKQTYIKEYQSKESLLRESLTSAHKMADQIKTVAQKEANFIVKVAQQKANGIVQQATDSLQTAYQDLSDLRRIHIQLKNTLKSVLQSHHDLLNQDPLNTFVAQAATDNLEQSSIKKQLHKSLHRAVKSKGSC